jgi:hypothetical protein
VPIVNPSLQGKAYPEVAFEVTRDRAEAFARSIGADPALGVPPTFLTAAEFTVIPSIVTDPELGLDFTRVVHGDQEYLFGRPLAIGDRLTIRSRIASIREKGGNSFLTIETELVDGRGARVALARATMVERPA